MLVDCTGLDADIRENTFMNSRGRLRQTEFKSEVEKALERKTPQALPRQHPMSSRVHQRRPELLAHPGEFGLRLHGAALDGYSLNLWNGRGYLNLRLPSDAKPGDLPTFTSTVSDVQRVDPFVETFHVRVEPRQVQLDGGAAGSRKPSARTKGEVIPVNDAAWASHRFAELSALRAVRNGQGGWDFFIDTDNRYLLAELTADQAEAELLKVRLQFGLTLLGLWLLRRDGEQEAEVLPEDEVRLVSRRIAPMILPMIAGLRQLEP